jgi:hypothetical protein
VALTVSPQTRLNLHMVVTTMSSETRYELGRDGVAALRRFQAKDAEHLTVRCYLFNRVYDAKENRHTDVLVYAHEDVMPRWVTLSRDKRLRAEKKMAEDFKRSGV